jgi:hypothetical protein
VKLWQLPGFCIGARELRIVHTHADGSSLVEGANGDYTTMSAAELTEALTYWAELRTHPALAARITRQIEQRTAAATGRAVTTSPAVGPQPPQAESATAAHVEAAEQRFEQLRQQASADRAQAHAKRERAIALKIRELREGGHVHYSRTHAIHVLDNEAKWAAQTTAHQARVAAATQPATPKPAPLRRVQPLGALDAERAQLLIADFGRRVP